MDCTVLQSRHFPKRSQSGVCGRNPATIEAAGNSRRYAARLYSAGDTVVSCGEKEQRDDGANEQ
jgi:hypothetical protein